MIVNCSKSWWYFSFGILYTGRQQETVWIILPKELCDDPDKPLLNSATGKFYPIEHLTKVGGKRIDCFAEK